MFFHVSFIVVFIGGLISFQTRMSGAIIVTEGETYSGSLLTINSRDFLYQHEQPYFFDPDSGTAITLEDFHINRNSEGVIIDSYANVIVTEGEEIRDATIKVNKPLLLLSGETITLQNYGFAPRLSATDNKTNTLVCDGFYKLPPPANTDGTTSFRLPYTDITIKARYEPVLEKVRSKIKSKFIPAFQILVTDGYGKEHIKGLLKMGETLKGDTISITLKDMKYWVKFTVVKDQGIRIVYAGFLLAAVSITWRLLPLLFRRLKDDTA
ncbi:MAG: cytochrome c biogenesis protein ResB [Actinomycetota bacterium]